jgi:hypothetical protein
MLTGVPLMFAARARAALPGRGPRKHLHWRAARPARCGSGPQALNTTEFMIFTSKKVFSSVKWSLSAMVFEAFVQAAVVIASQAANASADSIKAGPPPMYTHTASISSSSARVQPSRCRALT